MAKQRGRVTRRMMAAATVTWLLVACSGGSNNETSSPDEISDTISIDADTPVSFDVADETQTTPPRPTSTTRPASTSTTASATTTSTTSSVAATSTTILATTTLTPPTTAADGSGALPGTSPTTPTPAAGLPSIYARTAEAMTYVGAVHPVVAPSGEPVVIGFINQDSGAASFPESRLGARAAADLINSSLGGVKGRPIELRECPVKSSADGARCALTLATDPLVQAIVIGSVLDGEAALFDGIGTAKPVILSNPLTLRQFAVNGAVAYTPGPPTLYRGMAVTALDSANLAIAANALATNTPPRPLSNITVVINDNTAYKNAAGSVLEPALTTLGVANVNRVSIKPGATFDQASLLLAAVDLTATQAVVVLGDPALCAAVASTLAGATAAGAPWGSVPVVATESCQGPAMSTYLTSVAVAAGSLPTDPLPNSLPQGWVIGGYNRSFSPRAAEHQAATLETLVAYTTSAIQPMPLRIEYAESAFAAVLSLTRVLNYLGPTGLETPRLAEALRVFRGPVWGIDGKLACGEQPPFTAICGSQVRFVQVVGTERVPAKVGTEGIVRPASRLRS